MNKAQRDIRRKKRVLEHAARIGNVRKTCRYFGVARSGFYVWKKAYETDGDEGLINKETVPVQPAAPHTPGHRREGPSSPPRWTQARTSPVASREGCSTTPLPDSSQSLTPGRQALEPRYPQPHLL